MQVEGFIALSNEKIGHLLAGFFGEGDEEDFPLFRDMFVKFFEKVGEEGGGRNLQILTELVLIFRHFEEGEN